LKNFDRTTSFIKIIFFGKLGKELAYFMGCHKAHY
jgi:hypothetical protein